MPAPNLRSPTTVIGKTKIAQLSTGLADVLENTAGSNKVLKVNTIRTANIGVTDVTVDIAIFRSSVTRYLLKGGTVSAGKTLIVTDKNEYIYLEEGDVLQAKSSAGTSIDITVNYEEIN